MPLSLPVISYFKDCSVQQEVCHSASCLRVGVFLKPKQKLEVGLWLDAMLTDILHSYP